ncbi:MAG: molybdopterin-binding protein [Pseudomonadota bacterium]
MSDGGQPTAAMLVIGDEILSGRTRDANAHHLAQVMTEIGVDLREIRVVPDVTERIVSAVRELSSGYDLVFTSGGIGPTHDDITADAVGAAFGRAVDVRADTLAILHDHYGSEEISDARLRMARVPEGSTLIDNPVSRAPGFIVENVHVMAGVPLIFEAMLAGLRSTLKGGPPTLSWSLKAMLPESALAADLDALNRAFPTVSVGCYPFFKAMPGEAGEGKGRIGANIVLRATDPVTLASAADDARATLHGRGVEVEETPPESAARA